MIEYLHRIVAIPSTSGHEHAVSEECVKILTELGFKAHIDAAGNAIGEFGSGEKTLLFAGHIDTVPGDIPVRIEDGKLYGRGSVDAKGPFMAFCLAVSRATTKDLKVIVAGCVEEEAATSKGARYLVGRYRPDHIVIGEPSNTNGITLAYKGRLLADYTVRIGNFHSARGLGAADAVIEFYNKVSEFARPFIKESLFESLQWTAGELSSNADGMTQEASVKISFRIPPGFDTGSLKAHLEDIKGKGSLEIYGEELPVKADKNNALVRAFTHSIREHGLQPVFKNKTGTSDMTVL